MQRDAANLLDILQSAVKAVEYTEGVHVDEFLKNTIIQDAVIRRMEIIGEAARRISQDCKNKYPDLPWKEMTSMRNLLIHEYDDVDGEEVWLTVKNDLPKLISALQIIVDKL
jgi:uncharacterized protein with HEPN domain